MDLARWLTVDPIWPQQQAYEYSGSAPTVNVDPSGRNFACLAVAIYAAGALGAVLACLTDPRGVAQCLSCWCLNNPVLCGLLLTLCAAALALCIPGILSVLKPILAGGGTLAGGVAVAGTGKGSGCNPEPLPNMNCVQDCIDHRCGVAPFGNVPFAFWFLCTGFWGPACIQICKDFA